MLSSLLGRARTAAKSDRRLSEESEKLRQDLDGFSRPERQHASMLFCCCFCFGALRSLFLVKSLKNTETSRFEASQSLETAWEG